MPRVQALLSELRAVVSAEALSPNQRVRTAFQLDDAADELRRHANELRQGAHDEEAQR